MVSTNRLDALLGIACATMLVHGCSRQSIDPAPETADGVSVSGNALWRFDREFVPRGVQIVGNVAPLDVLEGAQNTLFVWAQEHYGADELQAAKDWGVDTIRLQIGQAPLDPGDALYHADYRSMVTDDVALARSAGFAVIVSIQAGSASGTDLHQAMPGANTLAIWQQLATSWKDDPGVLFHMYTQPGIAPTPEDWLLWRDGGPLAAAPGQNGNPGHIAQTVVGMQDLINGIRDVGANNVILIPGLGNEKTLEGMLALDDPAASLAFAVHSQPLDPLSGGGEDVWNLHFGSLKATVPVMVAEWDAAGKYHNCTPTLPQDAEAFIAYLKRMQIGVDGFAFDISDTLTLGCQDPDCAVWSYVPTTYAQPFMCGGRGGGGGSLLRQYYLDQQGSP